MKKKVLSMLVTCAMLLSMLPATALAADPDTSSDVINVDASNAQDVLDGKYGDITGKTIHFTENIPVVLDLARPTKHQGSGTEYVCGNGNSHSDESKTFTDATEFLDHFGENEWHTTPNYYRTLSDVTFTADEGVTVAGFTFDAGHAYGECYDYVRDVAYTSGSAYYKYSSLENITFKGLTITGQFDAKLYLDGCTVEDITFEGCTFTGTADDGENAAIKFLADNQYFTNITVKDCEISGYYQGVYIQGVDGAEIVNNKISDTEHNAIALQSHTVAAKGTIEVAENYITDVSDRAIRLNAVSGDAEISVNNNIMVDCGDEVGQLIKAGDVDEEATIDLESNYWNGKDVATAVSGLTAPSTVGITGGTWDDDVSDYLAAGYEMNESGEIVVDESAFAAKVGTKYFNDLQDAIIEAAPAGTVEILNDVVVDEWVMFAEAMTIGNGNLITLNISGLTINGNGHSLTINSIESAGNGNRLFYDAANLNIYDLTIEYADGVAGGIGLQSGELKNVSFIGGVYGVFPGAGEVTIEGCDFKTNGSSIYFEEDRDHLVVTGNTFENPADANVILLRGNVTFTDNTVISGRTVNVVSGSPNVSGNDFNDVRFKVYNAATATIEDNEINVLEFSDSEAEVYSTFADNTLSEDAQTKLNNASWAAPSSDNPVIGNLAQLKAFRDAVNNGNTYEGVTIKLADNIDLGNEEWTPIGTGTYTTSNYAPAEDSNVFCGVFDGNNKTISNLKITKTIEGSDPDDDANLGLFSITGDGAVIKDLTITNVNISTTGRNVGALAGFAYKATLDNITVNGDIQISGGNNVAGVCGMTRYHDMSATDITVSGEDGSLIKGNNIVGGIFAEIAPNGSDQTFSNLSVENIAIEGVGGVGGIVGLLTLGAVSDVTVKDVTLVGKTTWNDDHPEGRIRLGSVAGLLGSSYATISNATVSNVTAKNIEGEDVILPIVGANYSGSIGNATEAKVGDNYYATLTIALSKAESGDTITLLADVDMTGSITISDELTIDLNGHTLAGTDSATGSFGLINIQPGADLTINDSSEDGSGAITLVATNNREWNAYSSVISNQRGKLTVNSGTIEHLGGTDMAYGIDNLTNGTGTYAETIVNGGTVKSTYRAIRQFLNGTEAQNILTVNGGTIEGENKSIWMQDPSTNANSGTLTVSDEATLIGNVYLFVTSGSTEWPVSVSIADASLYGESEIVSANIPEGIEVKEVGGYWGISHANTLYVAAVKGVSYTSLQDAINAADAGDTILILDNVTLNEGLNVDGDDQIIIDLNGMTVSYETTESKADDMIVNKGDLTITDSSDEQSGKLSYKYSGTPNTSYSYDNATIQNEGDLTIKAGTVENTTDAMSHASYAINTNAGATLNVEGGKVLNLNGHAIRQVSFGTAANVVNISGGYIEGTRAVQFQLPGSTSATTAPEMTLNITGGELKSNEDTYNLAVYVYSNGQSAENASVSVSGDAVINGNIALNGAATASMTEGSASVTGGTLNGEYGIFSYAEEDTNNALTITGGTFATNYAEMYAEDGYVFESYVDGEGNTVYGVEPTYSVTITVIPADATIVVKDSEGNEVGAEDDGSYVLTNGTYTYSVTKAGYNAENGNFTVDGGAKTVEVSLSAKSSGGGGGGSSSYSITVEETENGDISVSPSRASTGTTVTISVDPDKGYVLETLTVLDKNGKEIELTSKGDGKYTFRMPSGKVTVKATFMDDNTMLNFFVDVAADAYYYDAVLWAAKNGITSGTSATTFSPDNACTRAQMATFLWRAAGSPEPAGTNPFVDIPDDAYYADAVQWAYENGITAGTSATTFSPDETCTRAQMATFLWREAGSLAVSGDVNPFADVADGAYYEIAVQWAYEQGITAGTSATTFSPDDPCTRAQMVTFLYRHLAE